MALPRKGTKAYDEYLARQAALVSRKRQTERDIEIPSIANLKRRRRMEKSPERFCRSYFPGVFFNPFSKVEQDITERFCGILEHGGQLAYAAPRGSGKSTLLKGLLLWAKHTGQSSYTVLFRSCGRDASTTLKDLRYYYESPAHQTFHDDYPEICTPILALAGASQRGRTQTVSGERTLIDWSGDTLIYPTIPGSPASGSILAVRSLDGGFRGLVFQERRPRLVIIDDPQTQEGARSMADRRKILEIITRDIVGLAGQGTPLAIFLVCTIIQHGDVACQLTDRSIHPEWHGVAAKFLEELPEDTERWQQYVELRQQAQFDGDETGRPATAFYRVNRKEMDEGVLVSNKHNFLRTKDADGRHIELSAVQHYYNLLADHGEEYVEAELQNNPSAAEGPETTPITLKSIQEKLNGHPQGEVPADTTVLTAGVDVAGRMLHWVVVAWNAEAQGCIVDYQTHRVASPMEGALTSDENLQDTQNAILAALLELRDQWADGWPLEGSTDHVTLNRVLVDSGWLPEPIYQFCRTSASRTFLPAKGGGTGQKTRFHNPAKGSESTRVGLHCFLSHIPTAKQWIVNIDVDYWKRQVHDGILTPEGQRSCLRLYGDIPTKHRTIAEHIEAELWTRNFVIGKGWTEGWQQVRRDNHYLDALTYAYCAASLVGVKPLPAQPQAVAAAPRLQAREKQNEQHHSRSRTAGWKGVGQWRTKKVR